MFRLKRSSLYSYSGVVSVSKSKNTDFRVYQTLIFSDLTMVIVIK